MNISNRLQRLFRRHQRPKIFCIGYNKTGTTSLEKELTELGYKMPNQARQEMLVVEELYRGNHVPLYTLCKRYDAFQDMPFSQGITYAIADALFPGSKFILTVREPNAWFESLARFQLKGILKKAGVEKLEDFDELTFKDKTIYLHKNYLQNAAKRHAVSVIDHEIRLDWSQVYNKAHRIELYERRNREIIGYFQERQDQLLVLDITKEKDNSRIVEFLELPKRLICTLSHLNRSQ
jgi:hypothetical protein